MCFLLLSFSLPTPSSPPPSILTKENRQTTTNICRTSFSLYLSLASSAIFFPTGLPGFLGFLPNLSPSGPFTGTGKLIRRGSDHVSSCYFGLHVLESCWGHCTPSQHQERGPTQEMKREWMVWELRTLAHESGRLDGLRWVMSPFWGSGVTS